MIFGYHPGPRQIKNLGYWNWMAFDIINAHFRDMKTILRGSHVGMVLLNDGKIDMSRLVTHTFPLEQIEKVFFGGERETAGVYQVGGCFLIKKSAAEIAETQRCVCVKLRNSIMVLFTTSPKLIP